MSLGPITKGCIYRAKRPAPAGLFRYINDRQVVSVGSATVQYDSPSVADGRRYPVVSLEAFQKWAASDVTDEYEGAEWLPFDSNKEGGQP